MQHKIDVKDDRDYNAITTLNVKASLSVYILFFNILLMGPLAITQNKTNTNEFFPTILSSQIY